jgi:plastocyanin
MTLRRSPPTLSRPFLRRGSPALGRGPLAFALGLALATLQPLPARAATGTVKGTVKLPEGSRSTRLFAGYWRLENGNVPVQNAGGAKAETVVVLDKLSGAHAPPARTVTVEIGGLDAHPRLVIVGPGSVVEIKNTGKMTHELSTPDNPNLMPIERLGPGSARHVKFTAAGGYAIRDAEYPHIMISVIVVDSPYYSTLDEHGAFSVSNVPEGKATLRVWTRGAWASEQEIDTGKKEDLTIKVAPPSEKDSAE